MRRGRGAAPEVAPGGEAVFPVRVVPRAGRDGVAGRGEDGAVRIRLAAPPVENRANEDLVRFLAQRLGVARRDVSIVAGGKSRSKVVRVLGLPPDEVFRRLGVDRSPGGSPTPRGCSGKGRG